MDKLTKKNKGFSTIELMISLGIMVIILSAVILVSYGNQSFLIGGQTNAEAMKIAQGLIEEEQALSRKDFNLVNSKPNTSNDIYTTSVSINLRPDFLTKEVTALVTWKDEKGIDKNLSLTTLITNFNNTTANSTCNSSPTGNWTSTNKNSYLLTNLIAGLSGNYPISDISASKDNLKNKLYVTLGSTANGTDKNLFSFDLSALGVLSNGVGIDTSGNVSTKGPNALVIASPPLSSLSPTPKTYAFLASGISPSPVDWSCSQGQTCSQLQIFDITSGALSLIAYLKLPGITGSGIQGIGKSIFYKNGYIFLGLSKTNTGPEFNIIDVHNPNSPQFVGSYPVGAGIDAIYVSDNYAYLATADNTSGNSLLILDITDPKNPIQKWSNIFPASFGYGNAVSIIGDTLYFGMTYNASSSEFFTLSNTNPSTQTPAISVSQSFNVDDTNHLGVNDIIIRDYLQNILTSGKVLQIRNTNDGSLSDVALPGNGTTLDCQNNILYVGDDTGNITSITTP